MNRSHRQNRTSHQLTVHVFSQQAKIGEKRVMNRCCYPHDVSRVAIEICLTFSHVCTTRTTIRSMTNSARFVYRIWYLKFSRARFDGQPWENIRHSTHRTTSTHWLAAIKCTRLPLFVSRLKLLILSLPVRLANERKSLKCFPSRCFPSHQHEEARAFFSAWFIP